MLENKNLNDGVTFRSRLNGGIENATGWMFCLATPVFRLYRTGKDSLCCFFSFVIKHFKQQNKTKPRAFKNIQNWNTINRMCLKVTAAFKNKSQDEFLYDNIIRCRMFTCIRMLKKNCFFLCVHTKMACRGTENESSPKKRPLRQTNFWKCS